MAKPRLTQDIENKKIIELEAVAKDNVIYVIRIDGVCFRDFRVSRRKPSELIEFDKIMRQLSNDILKRYCFARFIFYHDDEINIVLKGEELSKKKRIQKNLSLITSFTSVRFNTLLNASKLRGLNDISAEYYFDARFIEITSQRGVGRYIEERMDGVRWQLVNLINNVLKKTDTKYSMDELLRMYLLKDNLMKDYYSIFGYYTCNLGSGMIHESFAKYLIEIKKQCKLSFKGEEND